MANFQLIDETTNTIQQVDGTPIRLGRIGLLDPSNDNLVVSANTDNVDITTGAGNDLIIGHGGLNFINPGAGNNIMVGGTGTNDYFLAVPAIGAAPSHDTITNFHVGDMISFSNVPTSGYQVGIHDVLSALGPALEIAYEPVLASDKPILTVDLVGANSSFFQDDLATTRLVFDGGNNVKFVR